MLELLIYIINIVDEKKKPTHGKGRGISVTVNIICNNIIMVTKMRGKCPWRMLICQKDYNYCFNCNINFSIYLQVDHMNWSMNAEMYNFYNLQKFVLLLIP